MNASALVRRTLWLLSVGFVVAAVERGYSSASISMPSSGDTFSQAAKPAMLLPAESLAVLANRIAGADVFRLTRRPSPVAFAAAPQNATPLPPKPPHPPLALSGIIGGPPWVGILDGVPGRDQSIIVHTGDTLAGLRVRSITRDRIVVAGFDTTWRLMVHHPWP